MGLIFWWMLVTWIVLISGYWILRYILLRRWKHLEDVPDSVPIAHSDRLTNLPEYVAALKRYQLLVKLAVASMSLALLMGIIVSARPASVTVITPAQQSRDIMLCLDVSGSLLKVDTTLVNRFNSLVAGFAGQRFGLTVFNSSSTAVIPLSDDYQFTSERLKGIGTALAEQKGDAFTELTTGTLADFDKGTSLVSDGLVSCINNLGDNPLHRSQSVILATDNEVNGTPIITLTQATSLAEQKNIRLYTIDPGQGDPARDADHAQLKDVAENTGGSYYKLSDANTVGSIINEISKQEAKYAESTPVVAISDTPKLFLYLALVATVSSMVFIWRLQI